MRQAGAQEREAVSRRRSSADNVRMDASIGRSADQAWGLRILSGLAALPPTFEALRIAIALLGGRLDPLGAIFGACAGTLAALAWWFALRGHVGESRRRMKVAVLSGLALGGIGFAAGFIGPLILAPGANQGPLLGIFVTGPLGFVVGTAAGAVYARINRAA